MQLAQEDRQSAVWALKGRFLLGHSLEVKQGTLTIVSWVRVVQEQVTQLAGSTDRLPYLRWPPVLDKC